MATGSALPVAAHHIRGVSPNRLRAFGSAPAFRKAVMTEVFSFQAAKCSAVFPLLSRAFGSAPAFSLAVMTAGF